MPPRVQWSLLQLGSIIFPFKTQVNPRCWWIPVWRPFEPSWAFQQLRHSWWLKSIYIYIYPWLMNLQISLKSTTFLWIFLVIGAIFDAALCPGHPMAQAQVHMSGGFLPKGSHWTHHEMNWYGLVWKSGPGLSVRLKNQLTSTMFNHPLPHHKHCNFWPFHLQDYFADKPIFPSHSRFIHIFHASLPIFLHVYVLLTTLTLFHGSTRKSGGHLNKNPTSWRDQPPQNNPISIA